MPVDYDHFVLGPAGAVAGQFWASALSYLIITGSLACAAALTNAGLRYMYAMGREGLLPRYLGKTHPVHKSPYTAVLTWGAVAVVLFLLFRVTDHTGLDAYFWLSPQGVIWIVLVQALTALSVFMYFRRDHPSEQSWKTTVCAWIGFAGQIFVLALFYHYETFVAAGSSIYVKELFTIGSGTFVGARLVARHHRRRRAGGLARLRATTCARADPAEVRAHGSLRQRVALARLPPGRRVRRRPGTACGNTSVFGGLRHSSTALAALPGGGNSLAAFGAPVYGA